MFYNLVLLDELLSNKNVEQIGCCNELNAAYAAEGYARVKGCAAVVTTFNVGAFSALNGVAGANAERLPVIFVSAGYNTNDPSKNHLLHHTIATHDFSYQYEMFEKITCAAVRILHADNAPSLIDEAIGTALRERKPAYIEIACNLSNARCPEPAPFETLVTAETSNRLPSMQPWNAPARSSETRRSPSSWRGPIFAPSGRSTLFVTLPRPSGAQWRSCRVQRASSLRTIRNTSVSIWAR
jgi:TPP-dependent 2-oxoacid decarboxylase